MIIQGITVDDEILDALFACDYARCKGECCYIGSSDDHQYDGCEITNWEEMLIRKHRAKIAPFVTPNRKDIIMKNPTYKSDGFKFISTDKDDVCCMECGTCALQLAKDNGALRYGKPAACCLYPLVYDNKEKHLYIGHYFDWKGLCNGGYEKGKAEGIHMVDFLKEGIVKTLGEDFFNELQSHIR